MTSDQLAVVNNIDQFIVFGASEKMHITSPADYADHVAVICSIIGDIELFQQYRKVWEAMFGLIDYEGQEARQFLVELQQVTHRISSSNHDRAPAISKWLTEMREAAEYEFRQFDFLASTRISKDSRAYEVENIEAVFA